MSARILGLLAAALMVGGAQAASGSFERRAEVRAFIDEMVERHGFVANELEFLFSRARSREAVLRAIEPPKAPRERSWKTYRARFVNDTRIRGGTAFWSRSGIGYAMTPPELEGPLSQGIMAFGDSIGGMSIAGGIAAALFRRERSGQPVELDVSLLATGWWAAGSAIDLAIESRTVMRNRMPGSGSSPGNPLLGSFKSADGGIIVARRTISAGSRSARRLAPVTWRDAWPRSSPRPMRQSKRGWGRPPWRHFMAP